MSDTLKIALVQTNIYWENVEANLSELEEKLWALDQQVDLIILPEMFNTGFSIKTSLAEVPRLKTQKWMLRLANQKSAPIGGSYLVNDRGAIHNRFVVALPDGDIISYDKKNLFTLSEEGQKLTAGTEKLIWEYKGWKICPLICYDLRFPEWSRNKFDHQADSYDYDLLIYSANWPVSRIQAWGTLLKARAIENQSYVIGVNRIGVDGNDTVFNGQSQAIDHTGNEMLKMGEKELIEVVEIKKQPLDEFRNQFPFVKDSQPK